MDFSKILEHSPVFVAAPLFDPDPDRAAWNLRRAMALGELAQRTGSSPIVPHDRIPKLFGRCDDAFLRAQARDWSTMLVGFIAVHPRGEIWVLCEPDGEGGATVDPEVRAQADEWRARRSARGLDPVSNMRWTTWTGWGELFRVSRMEEVHARLTVPPPRTLPGKDAVIEALAAEDEAAHE